MCVAINYTIKVITMLSNKTCTCDIGRGDNGMWQYVVRVTCNLSIVISKLWAHATKNCRY